jgi:hypothetical protein
LAVFIEVNEVPSNCSPKLLGPWIHAHGIDYWSPTFAWARVWEPSAQRMTGHKLIQLVGRGSVHPARLASR